MITVTLPGWILALTLILVVCSVWLWAWNALTTRLLDARYRRQLERIERPEGGDRG